jgi:hypothetical protein
MAFSMARLKQAALRGESCRQALTDHLGALDQEGSTLPALLTEVREVILILEEPELHPQVARDLTHVLDRLLSTARAELVTKLLTLLLELLKDPAFLHTGFALDVMGSCMARMLGFEVLPLRDMTDGATFFDFSFNQLCSLKWSAVTARRLCEGLATWRLSPVQLKLAADKLIASIPFLRQEHLPDYLRHLILLVAEVRTGQWGREGG